MAKVLLLILALIVVLVGAGVDLQGVKDGMTGVSTNQARSMTGQSDDWG